MDFSLIIPAYNEAQKLGKDLFAAQAFLNTQPFTSEIIVVDDGSIDGTSVVARDFRVSVLRSELNRGKGYAVRAGMAEAKGDRVAFVDAGLCVPFRFLLDGLKALDRGADFALGSRRLWGAVVAKSPRWHRRQGSRLFHAFTRRMGIPFFDTQCGFKVYTRGAAQRIFPNLRTDGFMFDVEALLLAKQLGLRGEEFPVEWHNDADSRFHPALGSIRNLKELWNVFSSPALPGLSAPTSRAI